MNFLHNLRLSVYEDDQIRISYYDDSFCIEQCLHLSSITKLLQAILSPKIKRAGT